MAYALPNARILLVEDDDAIREMAADILGDEGYHVVASADAEHALTQLTRACPFDLLLSDICLPGMNGRDLADQARVAADRFFGQDHHAGTIVQVARQRVQRGMDPAR